MQNAVHDIWEWLKAWMHSPYAPFFLFAYSFVETLITLIPIDPFALAAMAADKGRAYTTAVYIVMGSLAGALVGYSIGSYAYSEWGSFLIGSDVAMRILTKLELLWADHEWLIIFTTSFVPIPKTPIILAAGFLSSSVTVFILSWVIGRSLHFAAEALIVRTATSSNLSYASRSFSVATLIIFFCIIGYIALSESGLSLFERF